MKITDIIRSVLDIIDTAEQPEQEPAVAVKIDAGPEQEIIDMQRLAGIVGLDDTEDYANAPQEMVAPIEASFPAGDDVHKTKNPADMRTDSISLYPDWQARR